MYPPLWGKIAIIKGAGMYKNFKAMDFIKANMPLGATHENPLSFNRRRSLTLLLYEYE